MTASYQLRKARTEDIGRILELIRAAQRQMRELGSQQWQDGYPARANIEEDIRQSHATVYCSDGEIAAYAAVVFDGGEPAYEELKGEWLSHGEYVVVHRLAVADEYKRRGIATRFMQEVCRMAEERGIGSFKVDTMCDNFYMKRMLSTLGFRFCGTVRYRDGERDAYEKLL